MANDTQATEQEVPAAEETQPADTTDTQPSEASSQVDEAPEATQEQATSEEDVEQTEVEAEDTAEEQELYAGKYKTVEDMEKAYQELQSKATKDSQQKAELTKVLNEAFMNQSQPPQQTQETDDEYYEDSSQQQQPQSGDDSTKRDLAVMKFMMANDDVDGESMQEVLTNDPYVKNIQGYEAKLEYAHLKSQNMTRDKAIKEAKKSAANQTEAKVAEKQTAKVESAKKAESVDEKAELLNTATTGTPEERDAARDAYLRKYVL